MQRLRPHQRQRLAQFDQRFEFRLVFSVEESLRVSIHQFLQAPVGRRWQSEFAHRLHPLSWRGNDTHWRTSIFVCHQTYLVAFPIITSYASDLLMLLSLAAP